MQDGRARAVYGGGVQEAAELQSRTEMDRVPEVEELKIHTWTCSARNFAIFIIYALAHFRQLKNVIHSRSATFDFATITALIHASPIR